MVPTTTQHVGFRTVDGVRVRYTDSDTLREPTVLLTSPWPESVYAFAPIWAPLAEHARLFAVDLPGFGASERREELLSPQAMGEFLVRLIAEANLGTPHLVAPDVGTAAALFAAAAHPERIATGRSSTRHWTPSPGAYPTTSARTIWTATKETASSSRCVTSAGTPRSCPCSPGCYPGSRYR